MSVISVRLPDGLLDELEDNARILHMPRAEYIRTAIEAMNKEIKNNKRQKQIMAASLRVRKNSQRINDEFSDIEDDDHL